MKKAIWMMAFMLSAGLIQLQAQDRIFAYTYQSNVLQPGQREIEVSNTFRAGRMEYFRRLDHRLEFELGIAKNLQTAFYLNLEGSSFRTMNQVLMEDSGKIMVHNEPVIGSRFSMSFSNEWKYKLSDPVANALGSALYGEFTFGGDELELEGKLILDKKFGNIIAALNLIGEAEFESEAEADETEMELEVKQETDFAMAYTVGNGWNLGFEAINRNVFEEGEMEHSGIFLGPAFSYTGSNFFINLTILPQVGSFKGTNGGNLDLNEYEKLQARLLFSYAF